MKYKEIIESTLKRANSLSQYRKIEYQLQENKYKVGIDPINADETIPNLMEYQVILIKKDLVNNSIIRTHVQKLQFTETMSEEDMEKAVYEYLFHDLIIGAIESSAYSIRQRGLERDKFLSL